MKKVLLSFLLCLGCTCFAQTNNNSVFWKISGNGLKEPSYLFGTIHAVPAKQFVINDSILKYLGVSKRLILEINPNIPIKEQIKIAKRIFLPKGKTIKNYIDSANYTLLFNYLKDTMKIKEEKINRYFALKPAFMETMLLMEYIDKPKTYETELKDIAGKKKDFLPLETLDEQMNVIDSMPFDQQLSFNNDNYKVDKKYFELLHLYLKQDLQGIDSLMYTDPDFKKAEYNLLIKRNLNWMPKCKESMMIKSTFIAVGCAHLIGENGLISLLIKDGYTLEPIQFINNTN